MNPSNDIAIELKNVFEKYEIELTLDGKSTRESFEALHDISFAVKKGEGMAVMGPNGAGKSTLLRLIAGLLAPERGEVKVNGRVGSLLDLGAGFHPELTGRDNLLLNASLYHFSREELDQKYEDILKFADIGKFINAPVRCYSQGMYVRLAFSLAIHVDPDIILIDDCLAVGDENFRLKSIDKVLELKSKQKTIVLVTHDLDLAKKICSKGIYLRDSKIIQEGDLLEVAARYLKPAEVDKQLYQYLSAKILEEEEHLRRDEEERLKIAEEHKKQEEERQLKAEKERLRLEEEKLSIVVKIEGERRKLEEEWQLKVEKERLRLEEEKQLSLMKAGEELRKLEEERQLKAEKERLRLEEEKQLIGVKIEEERRKLEEEWQLKVEKERLRLEEEKQLSLVKAGEEHRKLAEEWQLKAEKERQKMEEEKQLSLMKAGEEHRKLAGERQFKAEKELQRLEEEKQLIVKKAGEEHRKLAEEWQLKLEEEHRRLEKEKQLIVGKLGEEHRKLAEEWQLKAEKERQKLEEEKQLIVEKAGEEHRKLAEEWQLKLEEELLRLEEEKQLSLIKAGEEHRKLDEERQLKAEKERLRLEAEKQLIVEKAGEERRALEEEWQLKLEEERLRLEAEKQLIIKKAGGEHKKLEEEKQLKAEEERRALEEEKQLIVKKAGEERRALEEELQLKLEEERQKLEEEKQLMVVKLGEKHKKLEEERQLKAEGELLRLEEEKQLIVKKAGEEHRKLAEELQLKLEEEREKLEEEKQLGFIKAGEEERRALEKEWQKRMEAEELLKKEGRKQEQVLFCGPDLKFIINSSEVKIIHQGRELTSRYGMHTYFMIRGKNLSSEGATQRKVRKISDREILCFLRWKEPEVLFQVWHFKSQNDGTADLEIIMRAPETLLIENEAVDYCLQTPCSILGEDRLHNKSTIFSCGPKGDFKIETLQKDQVCGIGREEKDCFKPYFLTVSERPSPEKAKRRRTYFKGRFFSGAPTAISKGPGLASHKIESGRTRIEFHDGSCQLVWNKKRLTTGLGIYTSLCSNGVWYDSTWARWRIKESSEDQLIAEGFWPWFPIAQTWKILLKDEKKLLLSIKMNVFQGMPIHIQETVMMMSEEYEKWSADEKVKEFPQEFTSDDFFRFCLWDNKADGVSGLSSHSDHLPTVLFKPADMPGHRVIVENSQHVYGVRSRLFHCLRVNKKDEVHFTPGEYEFFKGSIKIKEEKV